MNGSERVRKMREGESRPNGESRYRRRNGTVVGSTSEKSSPVRNVGVALGKVCWTEKWKNGHVEHM